MVVIDGLFRMEFGVVVVVVDSKDKYTEKESVSNQGHPQDKGYQYALKLPV